MKKDVVTWRNSPTKQNRSVENNPGVSLTIPDMTLSLRDLLNRYTIQDLTSGFVPGVARFSAEYVDDPDLDGVEHLDRVEASSRALVIKQSIEDFRDNERTAPKGKSLAKGAVPEAPSEGQAAPEV